MNGSQKDALLGLDGHQIEAFVKQLAADKAFVWDNRNPPLEKSLVYFQPLLGLAVYALLYTIFGTSEEARSWWELLVLCTQLGVWLSIRSRIKISRGQMESFWAVRLFADGYFVFWLLTSFWEIPNKHIFLVPAWRMLTLWVVES